MNHPNTTSDVAFYLFSVFVVLMLYLLPTFIAFGRRHYRRWQILAANLFLGWTFLFWCYCLIVAISPGAREVE